MSEIAIIDAGLIEQINDAHLAVSSAVGTALEQAKRCGELLIRAKAAVPHGQWLPWLTKNTTISERTAQVYMRIHRAQGQLGADPQRAADSVRSALGFLAEPRGKREPKSLFDLPLFERIPNADQWARGTWKGTNDYYVIPSRLHPEFYYVAHADLAEGRSYVEGTERPVRAEAVQLCVDRLHGANFVSWELTKGMPLEIWGELFPPLPEPEWMSWARTRTRGGITE